MQTFPLDLSQFKSGVPIYLIFGATNCEIPNEPRVQTVRRVIIEKRKGLSTQTFFYAGDFPISHPRIDDPKNHDIVLIRLVDPVIPSLKNNINPICYHAAAKYRYGDCSQITVSYYLFQQDVINVFSSSTRRQDTV